jgi:hypothetical protein
MMSEDFLAFCDRQMGKLDDISRSMQSRVTERPPPASAGAPVTCPFCAATMKPGRIIIDVAWETFFVFGIGLNDGWFQPDSGGEREKILPFNRPRRGFHCPECAAAVLAAQRSLPRSESSE